MHTIMRKSRWLFIILVLFVTVGSCKKHGSIVEVKELLLKPTRYENKDLWLSGTIKEVGPLGMWFILEDESGYIQATTEHIAEDMNCLQVGQTVKAHGVLKKYKSHLYLAVMEGVSCRP